MSTSLCGGEGTRLRSTGGVAGTSEPCELGRTSGSGRPLDPVSGSADGDESYSCVVACESEVSLHAIVIFPVQ